VGAAIRDALIFDDRPSLAVDQGTSQHAGNVYLAWARLTPGLAPLVDVLEVSRSTDHGRTFSAPVPVVQPDLPLATPPDLAVGPDGAVYLAFHTFSAGVSLRGEVGQFDGIWLAKSVDGGRSFLPPMPVAKIKPFDSTAFSGDPLGPLGPNTCGDGPFACPSGLTFPRFQSQAAVGAGERGVHVVWNARRPNGQSKVFVRNSPDGLRWPEQPRRLDSHKRGHQWFPDIASAGGVTSVVFYDSRSDPAYAPDLPPGVTRNGKNPGPGVHAYVARSRDGGESWRERRLTSVPSSPNYEVWQYARAPFFGDYLYISAVPGTTYAGWTDSRDLVPGRDRRRGNDRDGFDVHAPCNWRPKSIDAEAYRSPRLTDPCLSQGGLDLNLYGRLLGPAR
jgi:hypothetical protein